MDVREAAVSKAMWIINNDCYDLLTSEHLQESDLIMLLMYAANDGKIDAVQRLRDMLPPGCAGSEVTSALLQVCASKGHENLLGSIIGGQLRLAVPDKLAVQEALAIAVESAHFAIVRQLGRLLALYPSTTTIVGLTSAEAAACAHSSASAAATTNVATLLPASARAEILDACFSLWDQKKHMAMLRLLTSPPFSFPPEEVRKCYEESMIQLIWNGDNRDLISMLRAEPFCVPVDENELALARQRRKYKVKHTKH
jgi:hypothetical protein